MARDRAKDKRNLTHKEIDGFAAPSSGRRYIYDEKTPGLCVCVTSTGHKSFYWIGRIGRKPSRVKLGGYPAMTLAAAREEAKKASSDVIVGNKPKPNIRKLSKEPELGEVYDWWMENIAKKNHRAWYGQSRVWIRFLEPWRKRRINDIPRKDVIELVNLATASGLSIRNSLIGILRAICKTARGPLEMPVKELAVDIPFEQYPERERYMSPDEMPRFFESLAKESQDFQDLFMLSICTAARKMNVTTMRWDEIDFASRTWVIPKEKYKGKRAMRIWLADAPIEILTRRLAARKPGNAWVFPSPRLDDRPMCDPFYIMKRVLERAKIQNFRIHDLRRTLASWQAQNGVPLEVISKVLGHKNIQTTLVYARFQETAVQDAMQLATSAIQVTAKRLPAPEEK